MAGAGDLTPVRSAPHGSRLGRARHRLPLIALPLAPVQGAWIRKRVPRFPDADGRRGTLGSGARDIRLVVLGDSVAAGYAVAHHDSTVTGELAQRLADRYAATVTWSVVATTGFTAGEAAGLVAEALEEFASADVVFISIGVNDTKNLHSATRFRRGRLPPAQLLHAMFADATIDALAEASQWQDWPSRAATAAPAREETTSRGSGS